MGKIDRTCTNDNRCKRRDNKFGVTWCIKCGKLFTKPSSKPITDEDRGRFNCLQPLLCSRFNGVQRPLYGDVWNAMEYALYKLLCVVWIIN